MPDTSANFFDELKAQPKTLTSDTTEEDSAQAWRDLEWLISEAIEKADDQRSDQAWVTDEVARLIEEAAAEEGTVYNSSDDIKRSMDS